jgi:hypothetical protein
MSWTTWRILDGSDNTDLKDMSMYLFIVLFPASIILIIFGIISNVDLSLIYFFTIVLIISIIAGIFFFFTKKKK